MQDDEHSQQSLLAHPGARVPHFVTPGERLAVGPFKEEITFQGERLILKRLTSPAARRMAEMMLIAGELSKALHDITLLMDRIKAGLDSRDDVGINVALYKSIVISTCEAISDNDRSKTKVTIASLVSYPRARAILNTLKNVRDSYAAHLHGDMRRPGINAGFAKVGDALEYRTLQGSTPELAWQNNLEEIAGLIKLAHQIAQLNTNAAAPAVHQEVVAMSDQQRWKLADSVVGGISASDAGPSRGQREKGQAPR